MSLFFSKIWLLVLKKDALFSAITDLPDKITILKIYLEIESKTKSVGQKKTTLSKKSYEFEKFPLAVFK